MNIVKKFCISIFTVIHVRKPFKTFNSSPFRNNNNNILNGFISKEIFDENQIHLIRFNKNGVSKKI